jgi:hypothetical protein
VRERIATRIESQVGEIISGPHSGALRAALARAAGIARGASL